MNGSEWKGTSSAAASPVFLNALYLHCTHCQDWAPSQTVFWYFEGFEQARKRGSLNLCRRCSRSARCDELKYRAFLADGGCREG